MSPVSSRCRGVIEETGMLSVNGWRQKFSSESEAICQRAENKASLRQMPCGCCFRESAQHFMDVKEHCAE